MTHHGHNLSNEIQTYWKEHKIDPANQCCERGAYPHRACDVELYEAGGRWSHIYGVCHVHKEVWHLQSAGEAEPTWPTLDQLNDKAYLMLDDGYYPDDDESPYP